jgi:hypothetical protein
MNLELLRRPEQDLQSRSLATQALPFHSECGALCLLRVQSNAARNTAVCESCSRCSTAQDVAGWALRRFSRSS